MQSSDEAKRFADWEVRPRERLLIVGGETARIGSRAFDVLLTLVQRRHRDRWNPHAPDQATLKACRLR